MEQIAEVFARFPTEHVVRALVILVVGIALAWAAARLVDRLTRRLDPPLRHLLRRAATWIIVILALLSALRELGFDLAVFLGAAGIVTVALGFASKTAASNFISGMFLIVERPFAVGEVVAIGDVAGVVTAIDLMSVKLRTFDNLVVRVPNETVLNAQVTNRTRLPIRRCDLLIGVAYGSDLAKVRETLLAVADALPQCFEEPAPEVFFLSFGDSAVQLRFSVWLAREGFLEIQSALVEGVHEAFAEQGIEIPFPQRVVHLGAGRAPAGPVEDAAA